MFSGARTQERLAYRADYSKWYFSWYRLKMRRVSASLPVFGCAVNNRVGVRAAL